MRKLLAWSASVALGLTLGVLMLPTAAQADHSTNPNTKYLDHVVTSHESVCGEALVHLVVPEGTPEWLYRLQAEVDDVIVGSTELVKGPGTSTLSLSFEEDEGDGQVTVKYYFLDATEWGIVDAEMDYQSTYPDVGDKFKSFEVDTDCKQPEPTLTPTPELTPTPTESPSAEPTLTCDDFDTQEEAQAAFEAGATELDGDGDGVACDTKQVSQNLPVTGNRALILFGIGAGLVVAGGLGMGFSFLRRRPQEG